MTVNKTLLPDKDSDEGIELAKLYPTASHEQLEQWARKYEYKNAKNFTTSVWQRWGLKREGVINGSGWEPAGANIPLKLDTPKELRTVAIICDTHNPYQDKRALDLTERFLLEIQPHYLIYGGDVNDFYQVSQFNKNPDRIDNLQTDIDNTKAMFRRHKEMLPNTERKLIDGNHEYRLQRFLWSSAIALSSLKCLTISELYNLEEYGIEHIHYEQGLMVNDLFLILHGEIASVHSGYTAKRMYEKHGGCGLCGHCHRGGSFYKRDRFGTWGWWEGFCLCSLNPDWIKNPNWVQGFSLVHFLGKRFWVEQIPIIGHAFMYGGKLYE